MKLKQALDEKLFDLRLQDRLLSDGKITQKELDAYLQKLEDDKKNSKQSDE